MISNKIQSDLIVTGSTIGQGCMSLASYLGYRELHVHGMDSSFKDGERHAGKHYGKFQKPLNVKCGDREFITTGQMISAAREFSDIAKRISPAHIYLYGDGLLQEMTKLQQKRKPRSY